MLFEQDIDGEMIEKTFTEILKEEASDNRWLNKYARGLKINRIRKELERIKRGGMSDEERLDILKNDLFWAVQDDKPTEKIVEAIAILEECKINDANTEIKQANSVNGLFNRVAISAIILGVTATFVSYISLPLCGNSQSKFCVGGRIVPEYVNDIFRETEHYKSRS